MEFKKDGSLRVFDGAIGTEVQKRAPDTEENLTELLNLSSPKTVKEIHLDYLKAGAEFLTTNTFSANQIRLARSGYGEKHSEINQKGAQLAREAIKNFAGDSAEDRFVAGSIGPTGETLVPLGDYTFDKFYRAFFDQAEALKKGGADWLIIETMESLREAKAALVAASEVGLPVISSLSYGERGRTSYGVEPAAGAVTLDQLGADVLGMNCGTGPRYYPDVIETYRKFTDKPLLAEANAGEPVLKDGKTVYDLSPAQYLEDLEPGLGYVEGVGSCCGSDPNFTKVLAGIAAEYGETYRNSGKDGTAFFSNNSSVVPTVKAGGFHEVEIKTDELKTLKDKIAEDRINLIHFRGETPSETGLEGDLSRAFLRLRSGKPVGLITEDPRVLKAFLRAYPGVAPVRARKNKDELKPVAEKYGGYFV